MDEKPWYQSRTIMGALATLLMMALDHFKINLPPEFQGQLTDTLLAAGIVLSTSVTIYGRAKASTAITGTQAGADAANKNPPANSLLLVAALALSLSACATLEQLTPPKPQTPAQAVYLAMGEYDGLIKAAADYNRLTRCDATAAPTLCSDTDVVVQLRKANFAAISALDAAEGAVRDKQFREGVAAAAVVAAQNALAAFKTILTNYGVKL